MGLGITLLAFLRLQARGACAEGPDGDPQHAVNGHMSANTWALTLILHRTQRVADEAINRALDCSLTSHRGAPWSTLHVTCVTRHAQNAKPTSRCRTVAPWSTTMRRVFHPETNGVKASPHRLKWMLSRGALAAPSDPWNFDASDVPPRQRPAP